MMATPPRPIPTPTPHEIPRIVVGVLIYNRDGEIFLARSHKWKNRWIIPGGHLEWGEAFDHCVKREVREETHLEVGDIALIDVQESIFSQEFHEKRHMIFLDFSAQAQSSDVQLNEELQECSWFKPRDALRIDLNASTKRCIEKFIEKKIEKKHAEAHQKT